jgi:hypothetical protein
MSAHRCRLCNSTERIEEHHTSYFPEKTTHLCHNCHQKVHHENGFHDTLQPEQKRPPDYPQTTYAPCVVCGETHLRVEMWPARKGARDNGSGDLPHAGRAACSQCTANADARGVTPNTLAEHTD